MLSGEREAARILAARVPALGAWGRWAVPAALLAGSWLWSRRRVLGAPLLPDPKPGEAE